ncbi:unnamed protein product, partial [Rhizoctonia solani]
MVLNICKGDVQSYIALGQQLQEYGHTVRISTHEAFRSLAKNAGLMFFNIGGDPNEFAVYVDRNPGLAPGADSFKNGVAGKNQQVVAEMLDRCLLSCYAEDEDARGEPGFAADLIISNPPTFAHIHCAEALGIPLHLSSVMPWSPTAAFPHPLVNIKQNDEADSRMANYYSYKLVDVMNWQGLGRTINKFRTKRLGLEYLSTQSAVGITERASVPWTYCVSPTVVPKPADWMSNIDVTGYCFLNLAKGYDPPRDLIEFIEAGEPPIYIGFGSIVLDNSENVTKSIIAAVSQAGVRAIISTGLGGLDEVMAKAAGDDVFHLTYDVPHDWLFERVCAVVHHGGAGSREYDSHIGPVDPVSGTILPGLKILNDFGRGVARLPSEPGKGATKMLSASTLGVQNTLQSAAEGMHNLPKVYGGEVRKHKKVTGIGSGLVQGGKGFALGLYDGFSDFFMEPVRGFKRGGVLGAIGGVGIGALNLTAKPTAGLMQAVSMPIEGAVKEVKSLLHR